MIEEAFGEFTLPLRHCPDAQLLDLRRLCFFAGVAWCHGQMENIHERGELAQEAAMAQLQLDLEAYIRELFQIQEALHAQV